MSGPILLFAGPSLPPGIALPPGIILRPPARCGDLVAALAPRPAAIALVDGLFETARTVWHKEILHVMDRGIDVYGAASLGALRAAELHSFGMIGEGAIFAAYRSGAIERDDAVMVAHAPGELGWRPLTIAEVDAHASIAASGLPAPLRATLARIASAIPFRERTWERILRRLAHIATPDEVDQAATALPACAFSQKERDTAALVATLATAGSEPPRERPNVPMTRALATLLRQTAGG